MMSPYRSFYSSYPYQYHLYKLGTLGAIHINPDEFRKNFFSKLIVNETESDFNFFIKSEIRINCFHSIETLFELIFALEPVDGTVKDIELIDLITQSDFKRNYNRIGNIASGASHLSFLSKKIEMSGKKVPLWQYLFFYKWDNFNTRPEYHEAMIKKSWAPIKKFLVEAASIFSKREEYNAYKHAFRVFKPITNFSIQTDTASLNFDLSNSFSFVTTSEDDDFKINRLHTRLSNTKKDINVALYCSQLISNIIFLRKLQFVPGSTEKDDPIYYFTMEEIDEIINIRETHQNPSITEIDFQWKVRKSKSELQ